MHRRFLRSPLDVVAAEMTTSDRIRTKSASSVRRFWQLLVRDTASKDLLWLCYVMGISPWLHRVSRPLHEVLRWQIRLARQTTSGRRIERLRERLARHEPTQISYRISLAELSPDLDDICRPMRNAGQDTVLASIDQDGFLCSRFEQLWPAPRIDANAFLPRDRFELAVVDHDGWVGVRKNFRGNNTAFVNALEASLDLAAAGCHVPPVLAVDFSQLSITFSYINGIVVREALGQAG